jgi:glycosyltransferase involved in cell wall biosynthesis
VLGPREQRPIALFYSRLHRKKRLLELIDLWLERGPRDWLLLIVGIPEDYTAPMLETYVMNAGQSGRVRAFDGSDQPAPYPVASLFLLPSHGENFGLSIAEALAEGVPALVTDTTPWAGLEREGAGWCVPWGEFAPALQRATALEPAARRQMGSAAREWVLRSFSWERAARALAEFYAKLRAGRPASPR